MPLDIASKRETTKGTPSIDFAAYCSESSSVIGGDDTNSGVAIFFASSSMRADSAS